MPVKAGLYRSELPFPSGPPLQPSASRLPSPHVFIACDTHPPGSFHCWTKKWPLSYLGKRSVVLQEVVSFLFRKVASCLIGMSPVVL